VVAAFLARLEQRPTRTPWLVFAVGVLLLLPAIWSETSVTCSDEYVLTLRTPMEMHERGVWLTPWCNEQPRLRKPPLIYWLILAAYKTLGTHFVAARIWGVLAGAGLAVVACLLERQLFRSSGWLAGLLTIASIGVAAEARQAMLDLPLALFASLAVLQLVRWWQTPAPGRLLWCAVWLGLSFLTKGPVGLLFFLTAAVAGFWVFAQWPLLRSKGWHWALWLLVLAAICLPWPLAMQHLWSDHFVRILGEELAERKFGNWAGKAPLSALGGALGLIFPWTPVVVVAAWKHFRAPRPERSCEQAWLIWWVLLSVTPFFFMKAFERYMLTVVPAQAVLASVWLQRGGKLPEATMQIAAVLAGGAVVGAAAFMLWFKLSLGWALLALALAGWMIWRAYRPAATAPVAVGAAFLLTVLFGGLYPRLGLSRLPPDTAELVGGRTARMFAESQPSQLSMRLGYSVQAFATERVKAGSPEAVFVEASQRDRFEAIAREAGLATRELGGFDTMFSRKAWLRFARREATAEDWRAAFRARSLDGLRTPFLVFEVTRAGAP
jgi:4-amino-4-deoxy-L-arabinose transferase-like glycosyltransferase